MTIEGFKIDVGTKFKGINKRGSFNYFFIKKSSMKNKKLFIINLFFISTIYAQEIDSVLRIKPEPKYEDILKYNQNVKYEDILEYKEKTEEEKESDYSFGFNLDINRELMTIEGFKIDVGTKFKGIN
jgi:hypothetical protein